MWVRAFSELVIAEFEEERRLGIGPYAGCQPDERPGDPGWDPKALKKGNGDDPGIYLRPHGRRSGLAGD